MPGLGCRFAAKTLWVVLFAGMLGDSGAEAQGLPTRPWQSLQMPSAAQVAGAWKTPPPEYGPEPYYGLNGAVSLEVIERDLDTMHAMGFSAVTVQAGYNMPFGYLTPEYLKFLRGFVAAARKRDMRVWLVDDAGYPSGFAGGKFTSERPELRMQALVAGEKILVHGGERLQRKVSAQTVAATAFSSGGGKAALPVAMKDGGIDWQAPAGEAAGDWTVVLVEHQFRTSPTRSDTNPTRAKDGSQSLEDYLDPAATAQFLAFTHDRIKSALGDEFGKTVLGFRGDEPDYSIAGLPWTPAFFATFEQRKGYDIKPFLAAFLQGKGSVLTAEQQRAKADYYDIFSQMFRDGFFKPQAEWCAANGLEYQVHLNHEELEMDLTRSEGEFFRDMRFVQVPGIDAIWHQIWTDTVSDFPRLAASAAHVYGHPRAFTESFAAYRPAPDVTMARYILNEQFARGVNLVETMYFPASTSRTVGNGSPGGSVPPAGAAGGSGSGGSGGGASAGGGGGAAGGGSALMRSPEFPALTAYTRRLSFLLSMGRPAASVALFLPSSSLWLGDQGADTAFVATERLLSERQVDFDIVDEDALASALQAVPGGFETASGNRYRTVILPRPEVLSAAALARLKSFAEGGGKVLFLGGAPSLIAGRTFLEARPATSQDFAWARVEAGAQLDAVPTPPAQPPSSAPEAQRVPAALAQAVDESIPVRDLRLPTANTQLRVLRRRLADADVFFLFNEGAMAFQEDVALAADGSRVERWDAQAAAIAPVKSVRGKGALTVPVSLAAYESLVLMVR